MESAHACLVRRDLRTIDLFDFFKTPHAFCLIFKQDTQELKLGVFLDEGRIFVQFIVQDVLTNKFRLQFVDHLDFDTISDLIQHYMTHYIYDYQMGVVTRVRLGKPVYNKVMSLSYLAGVALKKHSVFPLPPQVAEALRERPTFF